MSQDVTSAELTPRHGLPVRPSSVEIMPAQGRRGRYAKGPGEDTIDFDRDCPACGKQATWTETRYGTRVKITTACRTCDHPQVDLSQLPATA